MAAGGASAFAIEPLGETCLLLRFGDGIDAGLNARVHAAAERLRRAELPGIVDLVPAYATLALHYDALFWSGRRGVLPSQHLAGALDALFSAPPPPAERVASVEIPVRYGGADGADLDALARRCRLAPDELVARHAGGDYRVAMLGFAPGFPYLLGLDPALHAPRRATPRTRVPRGSVAIGGAQTGIYPAELPGGWHLIGRTPLALFDLGRDPPALLAPGDRVRFRAVGADEFAALERADA